ncbi:MAG: amidohydrolase, partial [Propionibacteriaceae bacterium]
MTLAIINAHVVPVDAEPFDGTVIVDGATITALGAHVAVPDGAEIIDAAGQWLVPGFIDAHTHAGLDEEGGQFAGDDTNEATNPNTAGVRAIDAINPADLAFHDALTGGVTTVNVTPGSANVIGGVMTTLHTHGRIVDEMVLKEISGLKAALGENPKRFYSNRQELPSTRLGVAYVLRQAWCDALEYQHKREQDPAGTKRDLRLENLGKVLNGELKLRQHAHRADDIATAIRVAKEFGYELVIEHGTNAAPIADYVAEHGVPVLFGPVLTSRAKLELIDRGPWNAAVLEKAGVEVSIITDHPVVPIEYLVTSAALCVKHGMTREGALRALTINPAKVLGLDHRIGSLAVGKAADMVLWSGDPFDIMHNAERVFIEGKMV